MKTAGVHLQIGLRVRWLVTMHAAQEAKFIGVLCEVWKQIGYPLPALPVLLEVPRRREKRRAGGRRTAVVLFELRLVVEGIDVRRTSSHAKKNDALRPRCEVRRMRCQCGSFSSGGLLRIRQSGKREVAETGRRLLEQITARERINVHISRW